MIFVISYFEKSGGFTTSDAVVNAENLEDAIEVLKRVKDVASIISVKRTHDCVYTKIFEGR